MTLPGDVLRSPCTILGGQASTTTARRRRLKEALPGEYTEFVHSRIVYIATTKFVVVSQHSTASARVLLCSQVSERRGRALLLRAVLPGEYTEFVHSRIVTKHFT